MSLCWTSPKVLAGNELFRVEKLPIRPCAHFIHDGRLEINLGIIILLYMRHPGWWDSRKKPSRLGHRPMCRAQQRSGASASVKSASPKTFRKTQKF